MTSNSERRTLTEAALAARTASKMLGRQSSATRRGAIHAIASALGKTPSIFTANDADMARAGALGMDPAIQDRLRLDEQRLAAMASAADDVAKLPDPLGMTLEGRILPNGLRLERRTVPLGVVGIIYESRPNVTVDAACLCLMSGNAVILRGGTDALSTNKAIASAIHAGLASVGLSSDLVHFIADSNRDSVSELLGMRGLIDVVIPRGGASLIQHVIDNAKVPVIETGAGVCHTYVDAECDLETAVDVVDNAKTRRYSTCNALDTVLVHTAIAAKFLPALMERWLDKKIEVRADSRALTLLSGYPFAVRAEEQDWGKEFLAPIAAIRVVSSLDSALEHIDQYGSRHSEAILTNDLAAARRFQDEIDAATIFVNASTQFTDGGEFGLGAEVGISTQKLHARGPMGLSALTTYKWLACGDGHTRS